MLASYDDLSILQFRVCVIVAWVWDGLVPEPVNTNARSAEEQMVVALWRQIHLARLRIH